MATSKPKPQDIPPGAYSHIRPGTNVIPTTQETNEVLSEMARDKGIPKSEVLRQMSEMLPPEPQENKRKSKFNDIIGTVQAARDLNLVSSDQKDPLNQLLKIDLYDGLKKDMKKGNDDRMSARDMMELNMVNMQLLIMQKSMGGDNTSGSNQQIQQMMQQYGQIISDLKAENEKTRQFYEQKQKEQEEKFKEIMLEKRIQGIEEGQERSLQTLSQQIAEIDNNLKAYQKIPPAPTEDQKRDAIDHLEQMGKNLGRLKQAVTNLGMIPQPDAMAGQALAAGSGISQYKNPDGSMNMTLYGIDKATEVAGRLLEAWSRKAPERIAVQETPLVTGGNNGYGQQTPKKQITYQEYYTALINKPSLTPEEQQWKSSYEQYVIQAQQERSAPKQRVQQAPPKEPDEIINTDSGSQGQQLEQPAQQPEEIVYEQVSEPQETPKKGFVERMQQLEAESNTYKM